MPNCALILPIKHLYVYTQFNYANYKNQANVIMDLITATICFMFFFNFAHILWLKIEMHTNLLQYWLELSPKKNFHNLTRHLRYAHIQSMIWT